MFMYNVERLGGAWKRGYQGSLALPRFTSHMCSSYNCGPSHAVHVIARLVGIMNAIMYSYTNVNNQLSALARSHL